MIYGFQKINNKLVELETFMEASWVNLYPPFEHGELEDVAAEYDIPLDFLTDSLDLDERSRYEKDEDSIFVLINTPILNEDDSPGEAIYITCPLGVIIHQNVIITVSAKENPILEKFMDDKVKNFDPNDSKLFVLQIFEQTVYRYLDCLKKLNLKRNLIEQELYHSSRNEELKHLLRIEKSLVYFVNSLSANDLLNMKIKRTDLFKINNQELHSDLFEDIIIDNSQALEMANVHTNILSGTMEAYSAIVSNNLNLFIHRLTVITIILMVPTVVGSFYGMNLKYLPFSGSPYSFFVIIAISCILGLSLIAWLRRTSKF
jgi:magnesium transporter